MSDSVPQLHARDDHLGVDLGPLSVGTEGGNVGQSFWNPRPQLDNDVQSSNGRTLLPDSNWVAPRTVAPDSVSPRDGARSTGPIRGQSEDPSGKVMRMSLRNTKPCSDLMK
jgi:hypothetical protein